MDIIIEDFFHRHERGLKWTTFEKAKKQAAAETTKNQAPKKIQTNAAAMATKK